LEDLKVISPKILIVLFTVQFLSILTATNGLHAAPAQYWLPIDTDGTQGSILANSQRGSFEIFESNDGDLTGNAFESPVIGIFNNLTGKVNFVALKSVH
jgi:hypothetical protein